MESLRTSGRLTEVNGLLLGEALVSLSETP